MESARKRLYTYIICCLVAAYIWLAFSAFNISNNNHESTGCLIKKATGFPCPSCGTTRSVFAVFEGDLIHAALINPLGILAALCLVVFPVWLSFDIYYKKDSFYLFYKKIETRIRKPIFLILVTVAMLSNWAWNIMKDL